MTHPISVQSICRAGLAVSVLLLTACGGGEEPSVAATQAATTTIPATAAPTTTVVPETVAATDVATTVESMPTAESTVPAAQTAQTTQTTPTTEPCGSQCPLDEQQQAAVDAFFAAYNGDDWDVFRDVLVDEEVSWELSPVLTQSEELMRYDFIWSAGLNETWTPARCFAQFEAISCDVIMEDDLHRALAPFGFPESRCGLTIEVVDDVIRPLRYNALLSGCHMNYDVAMHLFGGWFEEQYPDLEPIQGLHYRAWNQTDETAPARAREYLDEWIVEVQAFVDAGGDIMGASH